MTIQKCPPKRIKTVHPIIESTVRSLANLEIIKYIKFTEDSIQASNEIGGKKTKIPITKAFHPTAVGVHIIYDFEYNYMEFFEMNSARKGWGEKLVKASIENLPKDWEVTLVFDWSNGFWDKMQKKYNDVKWDRI